MASLPWHSYNNFNETAKLGEKANRRIEVEQKGRGRRVSLREENVIFKKRKSYVSPDPESIFFQNHFKSLSDATTLAAEIIIFYISPSE